MAKKSGLLDALRVRIRRFQLIVGMGLLACVLGAILTIPISFRLLPHLESGTAIFEIVRTLITEMWAFAVLPALLYGVGRIIDIRPWCASAGGVVTGTAFQLSIALISRGLEGITDEHPARLVTLVLSAAGGVVVSAFAVKSARAASQRADDAARQAAEARKDEYAQFAREAERLAARREARDHAATGSPEAAQPAAPPPEATAVDASVQPGAPTSSTGTDAH